jgi:serine protease Do
VKDSDDLVRRIATSAPGSSITLSVFRDGRLISLSASLLERVPDETPAAPKKPLDRAAQRGDSLGLLVAELGDKAKASLDKGKVGVVVKDVIGADPGTDELDPGDLVVEINRQPTPDLAAYRRVLSTLAPGESAWLYVHRPRPAAASFLTKIEVERP